MFSEALADKAMTDPLWRRHTALGRKVASKISLEDCFNLHRKDLICPSAEVKSDMNYELLEEKYF